MIESPIELLENTINIIGIVFLWFAVGYKRDSKINLSPTSKDFWAICAILSIAVGLIQVKLV